MYKPKVGDVIIQNGTSYSYTILSIVNNIITIATFHKDSPIAQTVWCTNDITKSFLGDSYVFPKEKLVAKEGGLYYYPCMREGGISSKICFQSHNGFHRLLERNCILFASTIEADEAYHKMMYALK